MRAPSLFLVLAHAALCGAVAWPPAQIGAVTCPHASPVQAFDKAEAVFIGRQVPDEGVERAAAHWRVSWERDPRSRPTPGGIPWPVFRPALIAVEVEAVAKGMVARRVAVDISRGFFWMEGDGRVAVAGSIEQGSEGRFVRTPWQCPRESARDAAAGRATWPPGVAPTEPTLGEVAMRVITAVESSQPAARPTPAGPLIAAAEPSRSERGPATLGPLLALGLSIAVVGGGILAWRRFRRHGGIGPPV
jgi:hypothetical protein